MTLLLLAGTAEGRAIADRLAENGVDVVASLAGTTKDPKKLGVSTRHGGFGGSEGFRQFLASEGITSVLDATHPFAVKISTRTSRICQENGLPYCQVLRPEWRPKQGDDWVRIENERDAVNHVPKGAVVFLATGRQRLDQFANMTERRLICRVADPQDMEFPFENGEFLVGKPAQDVGEEAKLFQKLGVDWIIARNAGGELARAKLDAARNLGLRVGMIERPVQPAGQKAENVAEALLWVKGLK